MKNTSQVMEELMGHSNVVFRFCLGFVRNPWDAEELMQEIYLKALKNIHTLRDMERKKEWLFRIARNTCLNMAKRRKMYDLRLREMDVQRENPYSPERQMIHSEQHLRFKDAVKNLPEKLKDVFLLKEYGLLTYGEIASALRIKEGTVMSRLNRARETILEHVKEQL